MKAFSIVLCFFLALTVAFAQEPVTPAPVPAPVIVAPAAPAVPTLLGFGVAADQLGSSRWNFWGTAIYPVVSSVGLYTSSTADVFPVLKTDPATGKPYYAAKAAFRQGVHKLLLHQGKFSFLLGGDAGVAAGQATSGMQFNFNGSFTATAIYQFSDKWAVVFAPRGMYVPDATNTWNIVPQVGVLFKP